jgi:pimeloyl-ACP methyl ester carboxylesterase
MKAYLIPGWGEDLKDRNYQAVLDVYTAAGYEPKFVGIDWNYKLIDDWVEEVKEKISKKELESSLLSGFSFGAMISLILAAEYASPQKLLLFSLSPYFAEDIPKLKKSWIKGIGKRKAERFRSLPFAPLAKEVTGPTYIFTGTKEGQEIERRAKNANQKIKDSRLIMVDGAGHDVSSPKYVKEINDLLNT